jgi:catechol 2,3-dioxygenase-like lactoylglutathione lyase family enzyme
MAKRRPRSVKRTRRKQAELPDRERRRRKRETLRLRSVEPSFTVNDIERSVRFYTEVLGFVVTEEMSDGAVLQGVQLKAGVCRLGLSQDDWRKGRKRTKGEGMRIWCRTAQDIDALASRIIAAGGRLDEEPRQRPDGVRSLSVADPDGFRLTIYREL